MAPTEGMNADETSRQSKTLVESKRLIFNSETLNGLDDVCNGSSCCLNV